MVCKKSTRYKSVVLGVLVLFSSIMLLLRHFMVTPGYPWGSDSMSHIYKLEWISASFAATRQLSGWLPSWYLGHDFLRYYPPLVYLFFLPVVWVTHQAVLTYKIIVFMTILCSGLLVFWGTRKYFKFSILSAVCSGLLYSINPYTIRTIFDEANLPRTVTLLLFPWLFFLCLNCTKKHVHTFTSLMAISIIFSLLLLTHVMQAFIGVVSLSIFLLIQFVLVHKKNTIVQYCWLCLAFFIGFVLALWWIGPAYLIPELPGFFGGLSEEKQELFSASISLFNPGERFLSIENIYIGLSIIITSGLGVLLTRKQRVVTISLGITTLLLFFFSLGIHTFIFKLLPLSHLLLAERFLNVATFYCALLCGFFIEYLYTYLLRSSSPMIKILIGICIGIVIGSDVGSYFQLIRITNYSRENNLAQAIRSINKNVRILNLIDGSAAGEYFPITIGHKMSALGWEYEASYQGQQIASLFDALETQNFDFIQSRLQLWNIGILTVKNNQKEFISYLEKHGYRNEIEVEGVAILVVEEEASYVQELIADTLVVGKNASAITQLFPQAIEGGSLYLEDYDLTLLQYFKTIILSHVYFRDEKKLEQQLKNFLALPGRNCIITHTTYEKYRDQALPSFFDMQLLPVTLNQEYYFFFNHAAIDQPIPITFNQNTSEWNAVVFTPIEKSLVTTFIDSKEYAAIGTKTVFDKPVYFVSLNLLYEALSNRDDTMKNILITNLPLIFQDDSFNPTRSFPATYQINEFNHFTLTYEAQEEIPLFLSTTFSPSWIAYVDSEKITVSNLARLLFLKVPSGKHTLHFFYKPTSSQKMFQAISINTFFLMYLIGGIMLLYSAQSKKKNFTI